MCFSLFSDADGESCHLPGDSWKETVSLLTGIAHNVKPTLDREACRVHGLTDEQIASYESDFPQGLLTDDHPDMVWRVDENGAKALMVGIEQIPTEKLRSDIAPRAREVVELLRRGSFKICYADTELQK